MAGRKLWLRSQAFSKRNVLGRGMEVERVIRSGVWSEVGRTSEVRVVAGKARHW
jgi:hypothetical protein